MHDISNIVMFAMENRITVIYIPGEKAVHLLEIPFVFNLEYKEMVRKL